jgi:thioredoxin reductase
MDVEVVVVGGGPAGSSAAMTLGRMRRRVLLIDDGQGRNGMVDSAHLLWSRDGTAPGALREAAAVNLAAYEGVETEHGVVRSLTGEQGSFQVDLAGGRQVTSRLVVLATGVSDELPAVPGMAELWGGCVLHCVYCHGWEVRDEPLAIVISAEDQLYAAARLRHLSADLTVFAHGFELSSHHRGRLKQLGIMPADGPLGRLVPAEGGLVVTTGDGRRSATIRALFVHPAIRQASELPAALGCRTSPGGLVIVDSYYRSSVPGVYAVGDMARSVSSRFKPMNTVVAAADGVTAGMAVDQALSMNDLPFGYFADKPS